MRPRLRRDEPAQAGTGVLLGASPRGGHIELKNCTQSNAEDLGIYTIAALVVLTEWPPGIIASR